MRICLVTEQFPPLRSSCAVQVRDLALELNALGHEVTVLTPFEGGEKICSVEDYEGVRVVRLWAAPTRDRAYVVRFLGEFAMPFTMLWALGRSPAAQDRFDAIAWYSPTIFFGPLVAALKRRSRASAYLILRDVFPEWAADLGIIRRNMVFRFLQAIARYQYHVADIIGVQTPANLPFFAAEISAGKKVEVLQNWMKEPASGPLSIQPLVARLDGRCIFVYAGNMGVAQGMDKLLTLATDLRDESRAGFLFVGRGSEAARLRHEAEQRGLEHCIFADEIDPEEIPALYECCHVGLVTLDKRHRWHNVPGKFISYLHSGLPVLASVNTGNDIVRLITDHGLGRVSTDPAGSDLASLARQLLDDPTPQEVRRERSRSLGRSLFGARRAADQLVAAFTRSA